MARRRTAGSLFQVILRTILRFIYVRVPGRYMFRPEIQRRWGVLNARLNLDRSSLAAFEDRASPMSRLFSSLFVAAGGGIVSMTPCRCSINP